MLRKKTLHDTVREQASALERQAGQLASWNPTLERRVAEQVAEMERMGRLNRFLPQLADLMVSAARGRIPSRAIAAR